MKCYYSWFHGKVDDAIDWGKQGISLKESSKIETYVNLEHNLNLAYRDSKEPENIEKALNFFLSDFTIEDSLSLASPDGKRHGTYFGNVGRCYEFIGNTDLAMKCYKKSMAFLHEYPDTDLYLNIGYAAEWIADLLVGMGQLDSAYKFYKFSFNTWDHTSKVRAQLTNRKLMELHSSQNLPQHLKKLSAIEIEAFCVNYIQK